LTRKILIIKGKLGDFAYIGMVECWNIGKMGPAVLQYWVKGKIRFDGQA
jgi:hypothetical protein